MGPRSRRNAGRRTRRAARRHRAAPRPRGGGRRVGASRLSGAGRRVRPPLAGRAVPGRGGDLGAPHPTTGARAGRRRSVGTWRQLPREERVVHAVAGHAVGHHRPPGSAVDARRCAHRADRERADQGDSRRTSWACCHHAGRASVRELAAPSGRLPSEVHGRPVGPGGPRHRHCRRVLGGAVVALVPGPSAIGTSTGPGTEVPPRTPTGSRRLRHR